MPTSKRKKSQPRASEDPWAEAIAHLRAVDEHLAAVIERIGPCALRPRPDRFATLVRAIIGQQISTKAAAAIDLRLRALAGDPHRPHNLAALSEDQLRSVGLSRSKAQYVHNLAAAVASGAAPLDELDSWTDEQIVACLTAIKGIGVWTAEMFLIFALNRPDVLPVGDLGVRAGLRDRFGLDEHPKPKHCHELAAHWRPFRSIAIWYLWASINNPTVPSTPDKEEPRRKIEKTTKVKNVKQAAKIAETVTVTPARRTARKPKA